MINCPLEVFESLSIQLKELHKIFFTPSHLLVCINNLILRSIGSCLILCVSASLFLSCHYLQTCDDVAAQVLGKSVFVNWPHLEEARIIAVSDGETK